MKIKKKITIFTPIIKIIRIIIEQLQLSSVVDKIDFDLKEMKKNMQNICIIFFQSERVRC